MAGVNDNLIPPKKGEIRNPKGKPKGTKHLSTIISNLLDDGNLDWDLIPIKNNHIFKDKYGKNGWKAITAVAIGQAISGDRHAREWLRKAQYGDKIVHDFERDIFDEMELKIKVVSNDRTDTKREATDGKDTS